MEGLSMSYIHPTAKVGEGTTIGHFSVIKEGVVLGRECQIGHHVVIHPGTSLGDRVRVDDHTVIGKQPMRAAASAITTLRDLAPAVIGQDCLIGALVVIYAGCRIDSKVMVADLASVREDVSIGEMTIIGRGVTVENKVSIGRRCKIESEAYITALSDIGDYCFVSPEVTFTNDNFLGRTKERFKYHKGVTMKRGARVGANATVMPGLTIEEDGLVGAGAVVTRDVPARKLVVGVPARVIKDVPQEQLVENQEW
jgi:UDP-2-acetamido-3-amino-2,3-dideoxy-glucuronate N-acetyltransferase